MLIIKNGKIVTMAGRLIDGGDILIDAGKIVKVTDDTGYSPARTDEVIDASDCFVFPGFIDAHCRVGVIGDGFDDVSISNNPIIPSANALYTIDYDSGEFGDCRRAGITTVVIAPDSAPIVSGKCAAVKTAKTRREPNKVGEAGKEHILSEFVGMQFSLTGVGEAATPELGAVVVSRLRDELNTAGGYMRDKQAAQTGDGYFFTSPTLENYIPILTGELPAFVYVKTPQELSYALKVFKGDMRLTLVGCEGCGGTLPDIVTGSEKLSVILGSGMTAANSGADFAKELGKRGIRSAISTSHPTTDIQYLPICAGLASREGMPMETALEAITSNAATICGLNDRIGSIEEGKDADIVIFDANPLEVFTKTLFTVIDGEIVYRAH